jgi:hypothetical protein
MIGAPGSARQLGPADQGKLGQDAAQPAGAQPAAVARPLGQEPGQLEPPARSRLGQDLGRKPARPGRAAQRSGSAADRGQVAARPARPSPALGASWSTASSARTSAAASSAMASRVSSGPTCPFHQLLDHATPGDLGRPSEGTRWTNEQLLFHMLFGYLIARALLVLTRTFAQLPEWASMAFARLLDAARTPFHLINYTGSASALGSSPTLGRAARSTAS